MDVVLGICPEDAGCSGFFIEGSALFIIFEPDPD
jgi:hypothetical protein